MSLLYQIFDRETIIKHLLFQGYNHSILSSSIPLKFYQNYMLNEERIVDLKIKNVKNLKNIIDSPISNEHSNIITQNYKLSVQMLKEDIEQHIQNKINELSSKKVFIESKLKEISYELNEIDSINNRSTKSMSNKFKKLFKKERQLINTTKNNPIYIGKLKDRLSTHQADIENINNAIMTKKDELVKFFIYI